MKAGIVFAALWCAIIGLYVATNEIGQWEARNHYPYGRMCDPNIFNAYHGSCRLTSHD